MRSTAVEEEEKKHAQAQPSRPLKLLASDKKKTFLIQTPAVFQFELGKLANQDLTVRWQRQANKGLSENYHGNRSPGGRRSEPISEPRPS